METKQVGKWVLSDTTDELGMYYFYNTRTLQTKGSYTSKAEAERLHPILYPNHCNK